MTFYQFAGDHPWLTFFLALIVAGVLKAPFIFGNRVIRHLNIRRAGWPPEHLDADGDFHEKEEEPTQAAS